MPAPLIDFLGLIMTPTANPAIGDIPMRGQSGGWTTVPISGASANAILTIDPTTGLPTWEGGSSNIVSSLPIPSSAYKGRILLVDGGGVSRDIAYICQETSGGGYTWNRIPVALSYTCGDTINHLFNIAHYLGNQYPSINVVNVGSNQPEIVTINYVDLNNTQIDFGTYIPPANGYSIRVMG